MNHTHPASSSDGAHLTGQSLLLFYLFLTGGSVVIFVLGAIVARCVHNKHKEYKLRKRQKKEEKAAAELGEELQQIGGLYGSFWNTQTNESSSLLLYDSADDDSEKSDGEDGPLILVIDGPS